MTRRALIALGLLGLVAVLGACGKKGPPVAPERRLPAAPTTLTGVVDTDAIIVTWTIPRSRVDGTRLRDLTQMRLHRRQEADVGPPKPAMLSEGQVVGYEPIARIATASPAPATIQGEVVTWEDRRGLTPGRRYVYVVTAEDSTARSSAPSERLVVTFLAPPAVPRNLAAAGGDKQVRLRWEPPAALADGSPLAGELRYLVLRGAGQDAPLAPITPEPVTATTLTDTAVDNDTMYRYAVRALRIDPAGVARGPASPAIAATPAKTTPPRPPSGLVAVPAPGGVRLAWTASPDEDVALYAVYRAAGAGPFVRIGTTTPPTTLFADRDVSAGGRYRYAVTAFDRARTPNESARSNEAAVSLP